MGTSPFDEVDRAILYHLQVDARKPITEIADAVNVSGNTVRNRIERMEDDEIIGGYRVMVNYDKAGIQHYYAFVCSARVSEREVLVTRARDLPGVVEILTLMTGVNNVIILAAAGQREEITQLAYGIDELGLTIEREHLIWAHQYQPLARFKLEQMF